MKPKRGWVYRLSEGFIARAVLVVSEDDWNNCLSDSVIVPLYPDAPEDHLQLRPSVGDLWADCTRIGGVGHEDLVEEIYQANDNELKTIGQGIRLYLSLDTLQNPPRLRRPPSIGRSDWWPHRAEVFYGKRFGAQREIYGVITDDEWNIRGDYATCIFLTSVYKRWRERWQIPISGGYAITGDLEPFRYTELDNRSRPKLHKLNSDDMHALANGIALTLEL